MAEVERRIKKYLERDRTGVRRELLNIFLEGRKYTTDEIHRLLSERGFNINRRGVSAMVGLISARFGILKTELGEKNKYYLKSEYAELLRRILEEFR